MCILKLHLSLCAFCSKNYKANHMETFVLHFLDWFFFIFHLALVLFNLLGWIWKTTRFWNLVVLLLTFLSWFGLGLFYGIGFCPLTEWHFQVLRELGRVGLPTSYISYLIYRITLWMPPQNMVDFATMIGAFGAFAISITLNIKDWKKKRREKMAREGIAAR